MRIGFATSFEQGVPELGVKQDDIAWLDFDPVRIKNAHQIVVAHRMLSASVVLGQIHHHASALHA
ncbi:hypothetical protein D3C73_1192140 [compost metagenome]